MKIDREKLSTLLKSGLHPEINTRKKLAKEMGLDPTSITRWFAVRDRLGNPRYPVVPDRHVSRILEIFNAQPQWLSLDNEAFRQQCFETAIELTKQEELSAKERKQRLKRIEQRRLVIDDYTLDDRNWLNAKMIIGIVLFISVASYFLLKNNGFSVFQDSGLAPFLEKHTINSDVYAPEEKCWRGFSAAMGDYDEPDPADPCHYAKLMNKALTQLKVSNKSDELTLSSDFESLNAHHDFLTFLSHKLDQRRALERIILSLELAKSELKRNNFQAATTYLIAAKQEQPLLPFLPPQIASELLQLSSKLSID